MKKEQKEWVRTWCDDTNGNDLPRVLLIGDSITNGYQEKVRELLRGVCYVDFLATSYAIDMPIYHKLVAMFVADSRYELIHFNNGLHGIHIAKRTYKSGVKKLLKKIVGKKKVILATSTIVYKGSTKRKDGAWMKRVRERNAALKELAAEFGYGIDDLYEVSTKIPFEKRYGDGTHYLVEGYELLAQAVVESIEKAIK